MPDRSGHGASHGPSGAVANRSSPVNADASRGSIVKCQWVNESAREDRIVVTLSVATCYSPGHALPIGSCSELKIRLMLGILPASAANL